METTPLDRTRLGGIVVFAAQKAKLIIRTREWTQVTENTTFQAASMASNVLNS